MTKLSSGDTKYLLLMRWFIINALGVIFVAVVWKFGGITDIIVMDTLYISRAIAVLFFLALLGCTWKIWRTSVELNTAQDYVHYLRAKKRSEQEAIESGGSLVATYINDIQGLDNDGRREIGEIFADGVGMWLNSIAYYLARLAAIGFIGTLVGIAITLKVFDIPLTDPAQMLGLINKVSPGLRIAVYPALLGGIAALWLDFLFEVLDDGTQKLISWVKKAGVYYAQQQGA